MAADIFESYEVTIVSGLILAVALYSGLLEALGTPFLALIIYPLIVRGVGVLSSIIGTYMVKGSDDRESGNAMKSIFNGFLSSAAISTVMFVGVGYLYLSGRVPAELGWWRIPAAVTVGVLLAILIDRVTEWFTGTHGKPVQDIKKSANTGSATLILSGISVGYESAVWATVVIAITIFTNIMLFQGVAPGHPELQTLYVLYGVAMTGIGMLTLTGNNVAMDSFGPIADNAAGIGEMSWSEIKDDPELDNAQQIMADLDAVGNTTKAITKGVAIGSAVIAAVALFASFMIDTSLAQSLAGIPVAEQLINIGIRIDIPIVFVGMLIGGALPWLFSSFAIQAVGRASSLIVLEARRQFGLGVLEGKIKPDYTQAVSISTAAAQKELVPLALLGIVTPVVVGLSLGVQSLGGFLAGIIVSGQLLAVFMNNAGGAWDNAKKLIEDEPRDPKANTGKGSERHFASVVGDTVGDPMKDTAGPALNPMIKVVNLVAVIVAPVVVQFTDSKGLVYWLVVAALVGVLGWAIMQSKAEAKPIE
jgi:K(+)-stimulated pyrophosphate-energized sodium pump